MNTGIVSDLDRREGIGLIDADDGHVVLFNSDSLKASQLPRLRVGSRVEFTEADTELGPRAIKINLSPRSFHGERLQ